jgi:hypothetical protein
LVDQMPQAAGIDDTIWMPEQAECAGEGQRKNIAAPQAKPDFREPFHPLCVWGSGEIGGVDRADRCANHEIRLYSGG